MDCVEFAITEDFSSRISSTFGEEGARWLDELPGILGRCAARWSMRIDPPYPLSYNYVAPAARADGSQVVLKLCPPNAELPTEAEALRLFDGVGVCRLHEYAPDLGAMLLERVTPGEPLTRLAMQDDAAATEVAVGLFRRIWRRAPSDHQFPTVADWARGIDRHRARFSGGSGPLPAALFEEGAECFDWLLASSAEEMLLHGDLHHNNILSAGRAPWLVIDPKGVVGDPGYELGAFLYNPIPGLLQMSDPGSVIARRIDQLADGLGMDRSRIGAWGLAQAILSACWSVDDGQDWRHAMICAGHIAAVNV